MDISAEQQLEQAVDTSPFKQQFERIRKSLFTNTASVLIGSGFSKNANQSMPSWGSWAEELEKEMSLSKDIEEKIKAQDVPWVAGAYEKIHDSAHMRKFLLEKIRDKDMLNAELHVQLVSLPWVDIFTTNYDKFLEESSKRIKNRHYITIKKHADILLSRENKYPRIIKLHGCIDTYNECIITEEDYRTYRDKHAPFVNTMRQSLLENILCIIGYSATDPDFLEWIGWVRDKLEGEQLKIYWISKDKLCENTKYIYMQRNITCINLNCFREKNHSPNRHDCILFNKANADIDNDKYYSDYETFERFLLWLSKNTKNDIQQNYSELNTQLYSCCKKSITCTTNSESILLVSKKYNDETEASECWDCPDISDVRFGRKELSWDDIQELSKRMKQAREAYPGWLLPPIKTLRRLWDLHLDAHSLVVKIIKMRSSVPDSALLTPLHEVCWLLDMACLPAFNKLDKSLEEILDASFPPKTPEEASRWMACSRLLLRWAREERDEKLFTNTVKKLEKLLRLFPDPDTAAFLKHQRILLRLENFDRTGALRLLRSWQFSSEVSKIWFIHKAMLLGELGDVQNGYTLLKKHYDELLTQASAPNCPPGILSTARLAAESLRHFSLLPEGGWLPPGEKKRYEGIPNSFQDTLPPVTQAEPDIPDILARLQADVTSASAQVAPSKMLFETGRRDNTVHFHSGLKSGLREVFQCIGAMEKLGRSPYLGYASFDIAAWLNSAQVLFYRQKGFNEQTLRLLLRSAPGDTFKPGQDIFLQYYLVDLDEQGIQNLVKQISHEITTILTKKAQDPLDERYARFGLELLSRLCVRMSLPEAQQKFLDWALEWIHQGPKWKRIGAFDQMCLFCRRAIESASYNLLNCNLARILSSSVLMGFTNLLEANHHLYFSSTADIVAALPHPLNGAEASNELYAVSSKLWQELTAHEAALHNLDMPSDQIDNIRKNIFGRYYWRLLWMLQHGMVDETTEKDMGRHVWTGYEQCGLPTLPNLHTFTILDWPVPQGITVEKRYKDSLVQQIIPPAHTMTDDGRKSYSNLYTAPLEEYLNIGIERINRLNLTYNEKLQILTNFYKNDFHDEEEAERLKQSVFLKENYIHQPLNSLIWILTYIFCGTLKEFEKDSPWLPEWIAKQIAYGDKIGAKCQRLKVLNLLFENTTSYAENLALALEEDIYSTDGNRQIEAGIAVLIWRFEIETQSKRASSTLPPCPDALCNATLRGFWLMEESHATFLTTPLLEQFGYYHQLFPDDKYKRILLRALDNKLQRLSYENNIKLRFPGKEAHMNDWLDVKKVLELLPEHRLAVGKLITAICKTSPTLGNEDTIKRWVEAMKNDPLASMRRKGEEAEWLLNKQKVTPHA